MSKEKEFATQCVESAKLNGQDGQPQAVIIDYAKNFGDHKLDFTTFTKECDTLSYDVYPLEDSILYPFAQFLRGKIVVQSKKYRGVELW